MKGTLNQTTTENKLDVEAKLWRLFPQKPVAIQQPPYSPNEKPMKLLEEIAEHNAEIVEYIQSLSKHA